MKTPRKQAVTQSQSREGHREAIARANSIKVSTRLSDYPVFGRDCGEWTKGRGHSQLVGFFTYSHLGIEVKLRFSQITFEWTTRCHKLNIEKSFPHQSPETLQCALNDWITDHLDRPTSPQAKVRQSTQAVRGLAQRHGISVGVANEIMLERAF